MGHCRMLVDTDCYNNCNEFANNNSIVRDQVCKRLTKLTPTLTWRRLRYQVTHHVKLLHYHDSFYYNIVYQQRQISGGRKNIITSFYQPIIYIIVWGCIGLLFYKVKRQ